MRRWLGIAGIILATSGCASFRSPPAPGPNLAVNETLEKGGWAYRLYPATVEALESASLESMNDLRFWEIRLEDSRLESPERRITARSQDGRKAVIVLRPVGSGAQVSARVGTFGDSPLARLLVDRVGVRLGFLPPSTISRDLPAAAGKEMTPLPGVPDAVMLREQAGGGFSGEGFTP